MLYVSLPPTPERYIAEIHNLSLIKALPFCIIGQPRATVSQVEKALSGISCSSNTILTRTGVFVTLCEDYTLIYKSTRMNIVHP